MKNSSILLKLFIVLLVAKNMLQNSLYITIPEIIEVMIEGFCYIYFAIIIIDYLKIKKWKIIFLFLVILAACYTGYITKNMTLLSSIMFMIVTVIVGDKEIIKLSNKVIGYILFPHIVIYIFQMVMGNVNVNPDWSGRTRFLLGFSHPNTSGIFILWWVIGKTYLSNYNFKKVIIYIGIVAITFYFNRCRSMLYSAIILLVITVCINQNIGLKAIRYFARNIIIFMSLAILILINLYNRNFEFVKKVDEIFSNRIFFSAQAVKENGYTLIGQEVEQSNVKIGNYVGYIVMDVTYTALYYRYGIIYLILLILLSRYITKNCSVKEYSLLIIYGVFALLETYSLNFIICFPMLFGAKWIGEKNDT